MSVISDGSQWGGRIVARVDPDVVEDRAIVTALGFTILSEDLRAGETLLWVWGLGRDVGIYIQDPDRKLDLPGVFFPLPRGYEITDALVRRWTDNRNTAY